MKRLMRLVCFALAMLFALAPMAIAAEGYEKALNSVVRIYSECTLDIYMLDGTKVGSVVRPSSGSGFAIGSKGQGATTFVTNAHVINWTLNDWVDWLYEKGFIDRYGNSDYRYDLNVKNYVVTEDLDTKKLVSRTYVSDKYDLACVVLNNPITEREPATIGLYDNIGRQDVVALGFPGISDFVILGNDDGESMPSNLKFCTVTRGMSQFMAENDTDGSIIQHTAEINRGNSGGPLVNDRGQVIGVNTWSVSDGVNSVNVSQTTQQLKQFLDSNNLAAEYVNVGSLPIGPIAIIAVAVLLAAGLIAFALVSGKHKKHVKVVDPTGTRKLVVNDGTLKAGSSYSLIPGKPFFIGTDSTKCNLTYPKGTPGVSRVHCSLIFDGKTVMVKDENSTYGTYLDENKLQAARPTVMHRGHKLGLGSQRESLTLR